MEKGWRQPAPDPFSGGVCGMTRERDGLVGGWVRDRPQPWLPQ